MATEKEFEDLVRRILSANDFKIDDMPTKRDLGFDFFGTLGNQKWAIEVKFYRTVRAQASLVEAAAVRLNRRGLAAKASKGMLILSCHLPNPLRLELEEKTRLTFIDVFDLANLATTDFSLSSELESLLETKPERSLEDSTIKGRDNLFTEVLLEKSERAEDTHGTDLCNELRELSRGKTHWAGYEKLCERILKYLFPNDLYGWHKQKRTDDGLNRFDFVCRIRTTTEFWQFLTLNLDSRYIIFEFKNYTGKIKQGQILTTEKYLLEKALRRVAIIFSRQGANGDALKMTQGAMREQGKLMLVLNDDDICKMLHMKEQGNDPTDFLFEITDNFLLGLPR